MTLRTYVIPLVHKHDDDLGDYLEPANVDGVYPVSHARMVVGNVDLDDEQHARMIELEDVIYLGLASENPQHD